LVMILLTTPMFFVSELHWKYQDSSPVMTWFRKHGLVYEVWMKSSYGATLLLFLLIRKTVILTWCRYSSCLNLHDKSLKASSS
jgi:hypothetical protein